MARAPLQSPSLAQALDPISARLLICSWLGGRRPSDAECVEFNRFGIIDSLRDQVKLGDVPDLVDIVHRESGPFASLCLSLLRPFGNEDAVISAVLAVWDGGKAEDPFALLPRILEIRDLPQQAHEWFFHEFVMPNLPEFGDAYRQYAADDVVRFSAERIADPSFPACKDWYYFGGAVAATDQDTARQLLREVLDRADSVPDPFVVSVARELENWVVVGRSYAQAMPINPPPRLAAVEDEETVNCQRSDVP